MDEHVTHRLRTVRPYDLRQPVELGDVHAEALTAAIGAALDGEHAAASAWAQIAAAAAAGQTTWYASAAHVDGLRLRHVPLPDYRQTDPYESAHDVTCCHPDAGQHDQAESEGQVVTIVAEIQVAPAGQHDQAPSADYGDDQER